MPKFVIEPHFRLQEWIAEEKGYFAAEGLDYEFREKIRSTDGKHHDIGGQRIGAYQSFEAGRTADVSCACHWTVNVAASTGHGRLYADLYSVAPAASSCRPIRRSRPGRPRRRADLGRLPIRQPLLDHPGARALRAGGQDQPVLQRRHAVQADGAAPRAQGAGRRRSSAVPITSPSSSGSARSSTRPS